MAPVKFGLFKARSRDYQEQPSTENLLHNSSSSDTVASPMSPLPSTSHATAEELALIELQTLKIHQDECEQIQLSPRGASFHVRATTQKPTPTRRPSLGSSGDSQINYQQLQDQTSTAATSTSTLQEADLDRIMSCEDLELELRGLDFDDGASTSCDANSLQFDDISIAPSEDISVHCGALSKKPKKSRSREEQQLRDYDMWHASNIEVMQNILNRSGTVDEQLKWEAIATARGLCTLTECCTCGDCHHSKYLAGIADGDAGIATAPLISAINGCSIM